MDQSAIIIQARMSSTRFPNKMMSLLGGIPLIEYVYRRCKLSLCKNVLIATSTDSSDTLLYEYCVKNAIFVMRGDLNNVLKRYIQAAESLAVEYIIRVCGDTPFVDIAFADRLIMKLIDEKIDYIAADKNKCSSGFYCEAISLEALKRVTSLSDKKEDMEHVTKFIIDHPHLFSIKFIDTDLNPDFIKKTRLTIDYPEDIQTANYIVNKLREKFSFTSKEILDVVKDTVYQV